MNSKRAACDSSEVPLFSTTTNQVISPGLGSKDCSGTLGLASHPVTTDSPKVKSWVPYPQLPWLKQHLTKHQRNRNSYLWVCGRNIYCKVAQKLQSVFLKKREKGFYLSRHPVTPSWARKALLMFWKWCLQKLHCCFWKAAPLQKVQTNMQVKCIRDNHEINTACLISAHTDQHSSMNKCQIVWWLTDYFQREKYTHLKKAPVR